MAPHNIIPPAKVWWRLETQSSFPYCRNCNFNHLVHPGYSSFRRRKPPFFTPCSCVLGQLEVVFLTSIIKREFFYFQSLLGLSATNLFVATLAFSPHSFLILRTERWASSLDKSFYLMMVSQYFYCLYFFHILLYNGERYNK